MCVLMGHSILVYTLVGQVALETLVGVVKPVLTLMIRVDLDILVEISFGALVRLINLVDTLIELPALDTLMGLVALDTMEDSAISNTLVG